MKVFLCHANTDKPQAELIAHSVRARGHEVFFDVASLPAGKDYERRIEDAIEQCDVFVFLISPNSVEQRRYTLTEMGLASRKWPTPSGHVLPVMISETPIEAVPSCLRAVTILVPAGNAAAETAAQVDAPYSQGKIKEPDRLAFGLVDRPPLASSISTPAPRRLAAGDGLPP
jgi:hypothetical protein